MATLRITAHARGGFAVFGPGDYDAGRNEVLVTARDGETITAQIEYPSTPSAMTKTGSGITSTTPAVSGSVASFTLSAIQDGGYVDITATVGGASRTVRIRGRGRSEVERYGG